MTCAGVRLSILLSAITTGTPSANTFRATQRSPPPIRSRALRTRSTASVSSSASSTVDCMCSVSGSSGRWTPGRSVRTSWASSWLWTPKIRRLVVCGLSEVIATLPPASAFTSVDLPTLGRPATATKPDFNEASRRRSRRRMERSGRRPRSLRGLEFSKLERRREQLFGRARDEVPVRPWVHDAVDVELAQPLAAAAAGDVRDGDRLERVRRLALGDRPGDGGPLRADPEGIRRALDVHALEDAAVVRADGGSDQEARVRRVRVGRDRDGALEELGIGLAHVVITL